ncbi:hypothetical protein H0E87_019611 [Populus deltoides]|uniref:Plastocyanin-like domain-containing protein n=1 Tax=Populus deltoides TaxID=3696 RepID=A0A8T2XVR8_POPDE|nr:hypothetical protein H0E87_019611 [Populus deltoides]
MEYYQARTMLLVIFIFPALVECKVRLYNFRFANFFGTGNRELDCENHCLIILAALRAGEWWKADVEAVVNQATMTGLPPNISDAHTVNGQTGAVPGCTSPVAVDNVTAIAFLRYKGTLAFSPPVLTTTPAINATPATSTFMDKLRSLNSKKYPANVPLTVDHDLYFAIGVGIDPCATCTNGVWFLHCHLEVHTTWGLKMAFVVDNGGIC